MKIFKKISEISIPSAIIIAGLLISLSIFLTVYFFFGGYNNRQKLFLTNPANKNTALTQQQLQQRAALLNQNPSVNQPQAPQPTPATTTAPKTTKK